jgi:hypothetical protein
MNQLLVTFGCSWTYGIGAGYTQGMSRAEYIDTYKKDSICSQLSFRGLLSKKYGLVNKNFSLGASSNQHQFRLAKEFFSSTDFKKLQSKFNKIIVLWGITSTARNELYLTRSDCHEDIFYSNDKIESKLMTKYFYNHEYEVDRLLTEIRFWDDYFKSKNINNLWFDTFNHHNYREISNVNDQFKIDYCCAAGPNWPKFDDYLTGDYIISDQKISDKIFKIKNICLQQYQEPPFIHDKITNLIFNEQKPRDLLSLLAIKNGQTQVDNNYHVSNWAIDSNRVEYLINCGVLNPFSHHPTQQGHIQISEMLAPYIESLI